MTNEIISIAQPAPPRHISKRAFQNRFTDAEAIAFDLASIGATPQAAAMRRFWNKMMSSDYVDLDLKETRDGVLSLEPATLLATGRALQILDAPVQESERYKG